MFGLSFGEIIIIGLIAILLFGKDDLPRIIRACAKSVSEIRRFTYEAQQSWTDVRNDVSRTLLLEENKKEEELKAQPQNTVAANSSPLSPEEREKKSGNDSLQSSSIPL